MMRHVQQLFVHSMSMSQIRVKDVMQWLYMHMVYDRRIWSITLKWMEGF